MRARRWFRNLVARRSSRPAPRRFFARLWVEPLEDRLAPATNVWQGASADWTVSPATNWSLGHVPAAGEDVQISNGTTVTHNANGTPGGDAVNSLLISGGSKLVLFGGQVTDSTTLDASGGTFQLAGGTLVGATVTAGTTFTATSSGGTLTNVSIAGTLDMRAATGTVRVSGNLTLPGGTVFLGDAPANFQGQLQFVDAGPQTVDGLSAASPGKIVFGGYQQDGLVANNAQVKLTLGANLTVTGASGKVEMGGATFDNLGKILEDPNATGGSLFSKTMTLNGTGWTNHGTLGAQNGGSLSLAGSWSNSGTVSDDQSTVNLGGSFTTAGLGTFTATKGAINLTGALDNTAPGAVLRVGAAPLAGNWFLAGGTITGGTVQAATGSALGVTGSSTVVGVTLDGTGAGNSPSPLDMATHSATLRVSGDLTLKGATLTLGDDAGNSVDQLLFVDAAAQAVDGSGAAAPGTVVMGGYRNDGLLSSAATTKVTLGANLTVTGAAGTVAMGAAAFDNLGTVLEDPSATGGSPFDKFMALSGTNWANHGAVGARNGGTLNLLGSWSNSGTISTDATSTLNVGGSFTTAGLGTFTRSGGVINLTGALNNAGATFRVGAAPLPGSWVLTTSGTVSGGTVQAATGSALVAVGPGGTLAGVTLDGTGAGNSAAPLDMQHQSASLRVSGDLTLKGATLTLGDDATNFADTLLFVDAAAQTVDGLSAASPGTIVFGGYKGDGLFNSTSTTKVTLGANLTVTGASGTIDMGTAAFDNLGTILEDPNATVGTPVSKTMTLNGTGWVNHGTVGARNGGTLQAQGTTTNFAAGTLTGGTWEAFANSTLRLIGGNVTTNAASILLDGANSNFFSDTGTTNALAGFATNAAAGTFTVRNGRTVTTVGDFSNAGSLTVDATGAASQFTAAGVYTQTAGTTTLVAGGALASTAGGDPTIDLRAGKLQGTGTVTGDVSNAGTVSPGAGSAAGKIAITGTYLQAAGGALTVKLGGKAVAGTDYDQLTATGAAALNGTLNVSLAGGFQPAPGDSFQALTFASSGGDFGTKNGIILGHALYLAEQFTATSLNLVTSLAGLKYQTQPANPATAGQAFPVLVQVVDAGGNLLAGDGVDQVTLTLNQNAFADGTAATTQAVVNGVASFSLTINKAGAGYRLTAGGNGFADTPSDTFVVNAAPATHLTVGAPAGATAGTAFTFTVTALDQFNNTAAGYGGTVHFTSSDGQAALPSDSTLSNGTGTFSATLKTAGTQTLTATDTADGSINGASGAVTVGPAAASHFVVAAPSGATAGTAFAFTVTALNAFNNTATGYGGAVHFSSSDGQAALPNNSALSNGVGSFLATLKTAGNQTLTATDAADGSVTGTSSPITVSPAAATHFSVSPPASALAGTAFNFGVTAQDAFNNTATGYGGTVLFSSSDGAASLPPGSTLTNGSGSFSATLNTAGLQTLTATDTADGSITGTSNAVSVNPASVHFAVGAPASAVAGVAFSFTVTAVDAGNHTLTGYTGTVYFTSSDGRAALPADYTFTAADAGAHTFTGGATLKTAGSQAITAADTGGITGVSNAVQVGAAAATDFTVGAPVSATAGNAFNFTVTALDAFNNTATGYGGTVHFTSSDGQAVLPSNSTLTNGVGSFNTTLKTAGSQTLTATDTTTGSITGASNAITVGAAAASHFALTAPAGATAGTALTCTVTALDPFNNTASGYGGTVHFTSSDGQAALPADSALSNGAGTFSATLKTAGTQTITATDTTTSSITGSSSAIAVSPSAATHFAVSAPSSATAGVAFTFTVTALDAFNNTATGYGGTAHFTGSDGNATLPADGKLGNGAGTFSATLRTAGGQRLTATDTASSAITGPSGTVTVDPAAATHFTVSTPSSATAGVALSFTVTAQDAFNNTATAYGGTAHFSSGDGHAVLPPNSTLANGVGTFSATLKTAGNRTITATDAADPSFTGTSNAVLVGAAAATHFAVGVPSSAAAGGAFSFTVTALDQFNNTATGYAGAAHFSSSDGQAALPADSALSGGAGTFSATLRTAGKQTLTATDTGSITGASNAITVNPAAAIHFAVSAPSAATAGAAFSFTVTAQDPFNNTATGYGGTAHFSSSDGAAALSADSTLTGGVGSFSATLNTPGSQALTATDAANGAITGTSGTVAVIGAVELPPAPFKPAAVGTLDPATATWYLRQTAAAGAPDAGQFAYGGQGWSPLVGDWRGSGQAGIGVFDPQTFTWYLRNTADAGAPDAGVFQFGGVGWLPVTGDWSHSGHTGIGAYDPSTATWYLRNDPDGGPPDAGQFRFGVAGGIAVAGDWTGTGHLGIGVFDPATATWYLRSGLSAGAPDVGVFRFGGVGWKAVAGDWAGTGRTGIGALDPSTGIWYLRGEAAAGAPDAGQFGFGAPGWAPVAGTFVPAQHLLAAGEGPGGVAALARGQLQSAVAGALARLSAAGTDPALLGGLGSARYDVAALPPGVLGLTDVAARRVTVSADAAGYGWFADASDGPDAAFAPGGPGSPLVALPGSPAQGRMDLLTGVLHEMGHLAGRPDGGVAGPGGLMADALPPGARDLGGLDQVFARGL
jgi:hypothetical protein